MQIEREVWKVSYHVVSLMVLIWWLSSFLGRWVWCVIHSWRFMLATLSSQHCWDYHYCLAHLANASIAVKVLLACQFFMTFCYLWSFWRAPEASPVIGSQVTSPGTSLIHHWKKKKCHCKIKNKKRQFWRCLTRISYIIVQYNSNSNTASEPLNTQLNNV